MKILIAEDDPNTGHFLQIILDKVGYETILVTTGSQAWEILQQEDPPKLAVVDWMMPGMSGVELCQKLRATNEHIRTYVVLLTAKSEMNDIITGLKAGADDYITKPFNRMELLARLKVGERSLELQNQLVDRIKNLEEANRRKEFLGDAIRSQSKPSISAALMGIDINLIFIETLTQMGAGSLNVQNNAQPNNILKPDFVAWTCLFLEQKSTTIDIKIEIDRTSAESILTKIVKGARATNEKILDMLSEIMNMTQANCKAAFNKNGTQVLTPYTPKAVPVEQFPTNGSDAEKIEQFHFEGSGTKFKLEVAEHSSPAAEKSLTELQSLHVIAEPVCWPDNKERIILNKGVLLSDYYILKLKDFSRLRADELMVSVYEPSPLGHAFHVMSSK